MPEYEYTALDKKAEETQGTIEADHAEDAVGKLRQQKLIPLRVKIISGVEPPKKKNTRKYLKYRPTNNPFLRFICRIRITLWQRSYRKEQERKRKQLLPRKEQITANVFAILEGLLRKTSIAQIGGFWPPDDLKISWFGDVLLAQEGEGWPHWYPSSSKDPVYLTPLAQFNLTEAPYVPEKLNKYKLITVFIDAEELPYDRPHGEGWLVRAYESFDNLVPLKRPNVEFPIKPFPIRWTIAENEGPSWEDACNITDMTEFNLVKDSDLYYEKYKNSERTKLGGFPALLQGTLKFGIDDFMFQIGTEEKAEWMWGDCGIGYFGLTNGGKWLFEWTCY